MVSVYSFKVALLHLQNTVSVIGEHINATNSLLVQQIITQDVCEFEFYDFEIWLTIIWELILKPSSLGSLALVDYQT